MVKKKIKGILGFYVGNMSLLLSQKYRTREIRISISVSCVDYQLHLALSCPIHVTKNSSYLVYDFLKLPMKLGSGVLIDRKVIVGGGINPTIL